MPYNFDWIRDVEGLLIVEIVQLGYPRYFLIRQVYRFVLKSPFIRIETHLMFDKYLFGCYFVIYLSYYKYILTHNTTMASSL